MQTEATKGYHYTCIKMVNLETLTTLNAGEDVEPQASCVAGRMQMIPPPWKIVLLFLLKLNIFTM